MIYERLNGISINIDELRNYFKRCVNIHDPIMPKCAFGGWSLLSRNGDYKDGWHQGQLCFQTDATGKQYYNTHMAKAIGRSESSAYVVPTQVCTEYAYEVIEKIRALNLSPSRARWTLLKANSKGDLHRDALDDTYAVRLHIPIITNVDCTFHAEGQHAYLPADGHCYLLRVNRLHQIFNRSNQDRIHIIMDVKDNDGITKYHKYHE